MAHRPSPKQEGHRPTGHDVRQERLPASNQHGDVAGPWEEQKGRQASQRDQGPWQERSRINRPAEFGGGQEVPRPSRPPELVAQGVSRLGIQDSSRGGGGARGGNMIGGGQERSRSANPPVNQELSCPDKVSSSGGGQEMSRGAVQDVPRAVGSRQQDLLAVRRSESSRQMLRPSSDMSHQSQPNRPLTSNPLSSSRDVLPVRPKTTVESRDHRPEELDAFAAELSHLGADLHSRPLVVVDDDSDDDLPPASDGTLLASTPARPLPPGGYSRDFLESLLQKNEPVVPAIPPRQPLDPRVSMLSGQHERSQGIVSNRAITGSLPDLLPPELPPKSNRLAERVPSDEANQSSLSGNMPGNASFQAFGFGADQSVNSSHNSSNQSASSGRESSSQIVRRSSRVTVNIAPTTTVGGSSAPEIRRYKKRLGANILCGSLWGVNLLLGTENGLVLLDRSGQGKLYPMISRRRFLQMEVLEGLNILVTISGKKNRARVYFLSWLKSKILKTEAAGRVGWTHVGDLEGCIHFKIVKHERIKFLAIALKDSIEVYAWAPKPYSKFMSYKTLTNLPEKPLMVDLTIEEGQRLKVVFGSNRGFHAIDLDTCEVLDLYVPQHMSTPISPKCIIVIPHTSGMQLLLFHDNEGHYVDTSGHRTKNGVLQWGEMPSSVAYIGSGQVMGWGHKAIEIRLLDSSELDGVFMHKKPQKLKFLCERNDKVFFSSASGGSSSYIYFMSLNRPGLQNW